MLAFLRIFLLIYLDNPYHPSFRNSLLKEDVLFSSKIRTLTIGFYVIHSFNHLFKQFNIFFCLISPTVYFQGGTLINWGLKDSPPCLKNSFSLNACVSFTLHWSVWMAIDMAKNFCWGQYFCARELSTQDFLVKSTFLRAQMHFINILSTKSNLMKKIHIY